MSSWIFQGNPKRFGVNEYLLNYNQVEWSIKPRKYESQIKIGDIAFIWRSEAGNRGTGGIVALGKVSSEPDYMPDNALHLWIERPAESEKLKRVLINIDEVRLDQTQGMLRRVELVEDPVLSNLRIIRMAEGTVFPVTGPEEKELLERWSGSATAADLPLPSWTRDEEILLLALYFQVDPLRVASTDASVRELSELLRGLGIHPEIEHGPRFRSPDGIYMKLQNLRYLDPRFDGGLSDVSKTDRELWLEFNENRTRLAELADEVRNGYPVQEDNWENILAIRNHEAASLAREELIRRAESLSPKSIRRRPVISNQADRDHFVREYVMERAAGICQLCKQVAPFVDAAGKPFLEEHHIIWLSGGGPDIVSNAVALCPNCHRKMHIRDDEGDRKLLTAEANKRLR